ncbi:MAG: tetratricopeptide repeat protein [Actinobacteria bacterium]|nr:tetratricopeptide repeat protein [Actinomycetota bacterium]
MNVPPGPTEAPTWADVSRAVRTAFGFAQEDFAASLQVSRKTVQRWERGLGAPDDRVEQRLIDLLTDRRVFERHFVDIGVSNADDLSDVLSRSRRGRAPRTIDTSRNESTAGLIGRQRELADVHRLIELHRLVTITGPGGVGKTTLAAAALHTSDGFAGCTIVELVEVRDAALILGGIAERISADEHGGRTIRDTVVRGIGTRRLLLLLDNLEHLPQAAPVIDDLLASCAELHILATSRVPLRLSAEVEFRLDPLDSTDATSAGVALFVGAAQRADPALTFAPSELSMIADLCARLDGLPLAIELAAARLRAVSLVDLHQRIDRALAVLGRGPRDRPAHQQTLTDSIRWSFDLLTIEQRSLMLVLGHYVAGSTLAAAESIAGAGALDDVVALVESGLISRRGERYRMLETVRDFVATQEQQGSGDLFRDWVLHTAETQASRLRGVEQRSALDTFADEYPNLRAGLQQALAAGDGENAHRLAIALCGYWDGRSLLSEARRWLELTLATRGAGPIRRATVHTWLGYFTAHQNDLDSAAAHAHEALVIWTEHRVDAGIGYARLILGRVAAETGRHADAESELHESVRRLRAAGDTWGLIRPLNALGESAHALGRLDEALLRHNEALSMCVALDDQGSQPSILCDIAHVSLELADAVGARKAADRSLEVASQLGNQVGVAHSLNALGCCHLVGGEVARAVELWAESEVMHAELGLPVERRVRDAIERDQAIAISVLGIDRYRAHCDIGAARVAADDT